VELLQKSKDSGKTIIVATHDERIIQIADKKLYLEDGKLVILDD
jgi:ABC-type lipoprotein export system ATPase subunit